MSRPSCLKKPWRCANSTNELFQKPRCATATFKVSAAAVVAAINAIRLVRVATVLRMASPRLKVSDVNASCPARRSYPDTLDPAFRCAHAGYATGAGARDLRPDGGHSQCWHRMQSSGPLGPHREGRSQCRTIHTPTGGI